ncbi:hypothetical protein IP84_01450 [beta proteobacterium AAP99]|nr:hypothetical protein IP84_01450 [beta proteobacterium AAP99]
MTQTLPKQPAIDVHGVRRVLHDLCTVAAQACTPPPAFSGSLEDSLVESLRRQLSDTTSVRTVLERHRQAFAAHYPEVLLKSLQGAVERAISQASLTTDFSAISLELIPEDAIVRRIRVGYAVRGVKTEGTEGLDFLSHRINELLKQAGCKARIDAENNPFRPALFIDAVGVAWRQVTQVDRDELMVIDGFGPLLASTIEEAHKLLNERLDQRFPVSSARPVQAQGRTHAPAGGAAAPRPSAADVLRASGGAQSLGSPTRPLPTATQDQLMRRLAGERAREDGPGESAALGQMLERLLAMLGGMSQARGHSAQAPEQTSLASTGAAGRSVQPQTADLNVLTRLTELAREHAVQDADQRRLALLAQVFGVLLDDPAVHGRVKEIIGRMQVPLLKVALDDGDFFFDENHPARRMMNELLAAGLQDESPSEERVAALDALVDRAERVLADAPDEQAQLMLDLDELQREEREFADSIIAEAAPVPDTETDRVEAARHEVAQILGERISRDGVPEFVAQLLSEQWSEVLAMAYVRRAADPAVWLDAVRVMDLLIWSVLPATAPDHRTKLIKSLAELIQGLNAGFDALSWQSDARAEFLDQLASWHASIMRTGRVPDEPDAGRPTSVMLHFEADLDALTRGQWLEFIDEHGPGEMFRISWISPMRTRFILTPAKRAGVRLLTAVELGSRLDTGVIRVVNRAAAFDRALQLAVESDALG